jgi:hypothetical protein
MNVKKGKTETSRQLKNNNYNEKNSLFTSTLLIVLSLIFIIPFAGNSQTVKQSHLRKIL